MNDVVDVNGGLIATAKSLNEAVQPQTEWEVQCVVAQLGSLRLFASSAKEAMEKAAKTQGVIWPLAYRPASAAITALAANGPPA